MKISSERLNMAVWNFLRVTEEMGIRTTADLEAHLGQRLNVGECDHIDFSRRPSNAGTTALTASYFIEGSGIPIEVRCNSALGYSKVVVKTEKNVIGYTPFAVDPFGNQAQDATLETSEFSNVCELLRKQFPYVH
ncbi:MAG TPA: hypothetical protein VJG90_06000 [Candidatus Nanoarchaeia archaeon]|nr:hypothetical protein [Candidatus Nanoarchaeia archaeon]